ncbi:MAG TPA: hypothetical protein VFY93_02745 [Planctomycetota bacterium]|nr:hypothetical protein [Planctomycetota bacterium]
MKEPEVYTVETEFGYMVQVGPDRRPCVVELHAGGALRLVAATMRVPRFLREVWQRDRHGLRSEFMSWRVVVWRARSEGVAHAEKARRIEALRWGVGTLRNAEKPDVLRGHAAYLLRTERDRRAARRAS